MEKDYYNTLGVDKNASSDEIKKAYRKMAHKHHPDKSGDDLRFKEVNEAYQVLGDKQKRSQYDQFGPAGFGGGSPGGQGGFGGGQGFNWDFSGGGAEGFSDIFEDLFSGAGFGQRQTQRQQEKGLDLKMHITINLEDSAFGSTKDISVPRMMHCENCKGSGAESDTEMIKCSTCGGRGTQEKIFKTIFGVMKQQGVCDACLGKGHTPKTKCKKCRGEGIEKKTDSFKVKIPQGISDGEMFKIPNKGYDASHGMESGNLFVVVATTPHKTFKRAGDDLIMSLLVNFTQIVFGDKVEVETLYKKVKLKIPEGVQSGKVIKISGYGMPKKHGFGKGDLLVKVSVKTPTKLSRKQKNLLEDLKKEGI